MAEFRALDTGSMQKQDVVEMRMAHSDKFSGTCFLTAQTAMGHHDQGFVGGLQRVLRFDLQNTVGRTNCQSAPPGTTFLCSNGPVTSPPRIGTIQLMRT